MRLGWWRRDFNPRSPRGERPRKFGQVVHYLIISIHAPRAGSDNNPYSLRLHLIISIHAPRAGSDDAG